MVQFWNLKSSDKFGFSSQKNKIFGQHFEQKKTPSKSLNKGNNMNHTDVTWGKKKNKKCQEYMTMKLFKL